MRREDATEFVAGGDQREGEGGLAAHGADGGKVPADRAKNFIHDDEGVLTDDKERLPGINGKKPGDAVAVTHRDDGTGEQKGAGLPAVIAVCDQQSCADGGYCGGFVHGNQIDGVRPQSSPQAGRRNRDY